MPTSETTLTEGIEIFADCISNGWWNAAQSWAEFCFLVVESEGYHED